MRVAPVALVAIVAVLTGCTSDPDRSGPAGASPTATGLRPGPDFQDPGPAPQGGGTLRVVSSSGPGYLDPDLGAYWLDYSILRTFSRQLYTWPADGRPASTVVPDLAENPPAVDETGTVYTMTIRRGARWDTSPSRQVTAEDVVRGVKMTCNPVLSATTLLDFRDVIAGMHSFCSQFRHVARRPVPMQRFLATHRLAGVHAGAGARDVVFELTHPVNFFPQLLALPAQSPRPRELMKYRPGSLAAARHSIADGPYRLKSYTREAYASEESERAPGRIVLERNPVWQTSTDPVRKAFVDRIVVTFETQVHDARHVALRAVRSGRADLSLSPLGTADGRRLVQAGDPHVEVHPTATSGPTIVFNTVSPNNNGALQDVNVRRAIAFALDRVALGRAFGGAELAPPLTHVLPDGMLGSQDFDPYPHDPERARAMLRDAAVSDLELRVYYPSYSKEATKLFDILRRQLRQVGIDTPRFYIDESWPRQLYEPRAARRGSWDLAVGGTFADWPGNAAWSIFRPLFDGRGVGADPRSLPNWSYNMGLYDNPEVDRLIDAAPQADLGAAADLWHRADELVMQDAPFYPIAQSNAATYHGDRVRHDVFVPAQLGADLTNIWLARHKG
jgi:peptide/nickel transport system substrate-binding protein